jgi:hypothetical protein
MKPVSNKARGKFNDSPKRGSLKSYLFLNGLGLYTVLNLC